MGALKVLKVSQYLILAAVLAVTTAGGYLGYRRFAPRPAVAARVNTADVTRGSIVATVNATGSVASPAQSKLAFKSGGRLTQLLVSVGEQVAEGQPLARIDDADLQVALLQAQANHSSALAKLEQTKAGSKPEDIRAAQAQVEAARIKLDQARSVGGGPEAAAAQSQVEAARIKLNQVLAGGRPEDVAAAQAQLEAAIAKFQSLASPRAEDLATAQAQLDAATAKLQALTNPRPEDLAAAQSQVESARIKLAQLFNPRPEDLRNAEASVVSARAKLQALLNPRPEDVAAAQSAVDQAQTKLAQLVDLPRTAKPEDIANAELAVKSAQVQLDKARTDALTAGRPGSNLTAAAAEAAIQQALINLQTAQNNLGKLQAQGPSEWDVRLQQEAVSQAQANLNKLLRPAPADVQAAQAAVEQAQAQLDKLRIPNPFEVQAAQETVNQAQASLEKLLNPSPPDVASAQQAVAQAQGTLDKLLNPSPSDVAGAQQSIAQAQASLDKLLNPSSFDVQAGQQSVVQAQASLDKLLTGNAFDVQAAQASLNQVQANLELKQAGPATYDIAIAMATVDQAQAQLRQAEANLAAATLAAPYAGTVAATGANLGEQVGSSAAVVTLVDTRQVRIDVVVDETDVAKVQPGQQANLSFEALPGQRVAGRVVVVAPVATVQQGVVSYQVQIQVDPAQARNIRPGMTATANIVTASKEDVVLAPNRAIRSQGRNRFVEVLEVDGKTATRQVQVGMTSDQVSEIVGGLQPGDRVVIPTTSTAPARVPGFGGAGGPAPAGPGGPGVVVR